MGFKENIKTGLGKAERPRQAFCLMCLKSGQPVGNPCGKLRGRGSIRPSGYPAGLSMHEAQSIVVPGLPIW